MARSEYIYEDARLNDSHAYLLPAVFRQLKGSSPTKMRMFDLGCGNGSVAASLAKHGYEVTGVDSSEGGIAEANREYPQLSLSVGSVYDDLMARYGQFPIVLSLEVVEHLYSPRHYARTLFDLVEPGGICIVSTPYHGYWKNVALSITGKMDAHFTALWDHGHIKFWSKKTLKALLVEAGFVHIRFSRVGRIPIFAKSMLVTARRPMR